VSALACRSSRRSAATSPATTRSPRRVEGTRSHGDPVAVSEAGVQHACNKLYSVVIVDTAGRLAIDENLMQQAADIRAAIQPDEVLFVIDAMIGQAAVETAEAFLHGVDFTGVVLTKLDGDARGGAALSVASVTGRPIMFASTGEGVKDFEVFHPDRMASRILDMGDVLTLIEQAEKAFDQRHAAEMERKFLAPRTSPSTTSSSRWRPSRRWAR
jgi:signal recognition particle subunit SRP54